MTFLPEDLEKTLGVSICVWNSRTELLSTFETPM
jgi:hypothetical protein